MRTVLMVAEKPSLAQSIAKILSKGSCTSRKGLNGACSVHEYSGSFQGQTVRFKMTSVCGHVMSLDFTGKYNNWDKVDPAELFSKAPTEKKEANPKLNMVKFLQVEARGSDYVVLWLDCDKEGENICFEVLDAIHPVMNKGSVRDQSVFRAKFSSITDTDIWNAMNRLGEPNRNEALSVDARQELDLRIGCAFTRFQTKYFQGKYGNLDSSLISFGPCQTPTLGFCVERHDKIQSFKPETYWVLQAKVFKGKDTPLTLDWNRVRVFDREVGQMFVNLAKTSKEAQVESVSKKEKAKQRPQALNTVEMLRVASSALGMGPQHAMQIAERLYTQGYISYPRTETTHYPENFDLKATLKQQINNPVWAEE
ncbi:DNA topoisomerase 3-beta-1, partial [Goodea atripinnis]